MNYLDLAGLTLLHDERDTELPPEYVAEVGGPDDATLLDPRNRLLLLKRLREGAGVHIYTGPSGLAFWQAASIEVRLHVVPDGYDVAERMPPDMCWALCAVGCTPVLARGLVRHYGEGKEPTERAAVYGKWQAAKKLLADYENCYAGPPIIVEAHSINAITDPAEQLALLDRVGNCALDWEWNVDPVVAPLNEPEGLSVATADRTWYLPVVALGFSTPAAHPTRLREAVARVIRRTNTTWHHGKADLKAQYLGDPLDLHGADLDDTLVQAFVAGEHDLGLKQLAKKLLGRDPLDYPGAMRNLPLATCTRYGGADARNTFDLAVKLYEKLHEREQVRVYEEIEKPIIPLLTSMERYGHPISPERTRELRENFYATEEAIRQRFWADERLDIARDSDTRELVRRRTGYDPGTCRKDALAKIPGDWMDSILGYRQLRHQRRAFLDRHLNRTPANDGLIYLYTDFAQAGSTDPNDPRGFKRAPRNTRLSSSGGVNLQNQPQSIRSIFVAPPDCAVWKYDYDQIELRTGAALSGDQAMLDDLATGDMHEATRLRLLGNTGKDLNRNAVKQFNFSGAYGGHADIARTILQKQRLFFDDDLLVEMADARREIYKSYYQHGDQIVAFAKNSGYAETAFGRRRYEPDIRSSDQKLALHAARSLTNFALGSGTAADILKIAMRLVVPVLQYYDAHMSIQVHDELVGWVPRDNAEAFDANMRAVLSSVSLPGMRFTVSGGYGETWEAAKEHK